MYKLSKPQKLLYGCGVFVFAFFVLVIGYFTLTTGSIQPASLSTSISSKSATSSNVSSSAASVTTKTNCTTGSAEVQILCQINAYRTEEGLDELTLNTKLSQVATTQSLYMYNQSQLSDTGFDDVTVQEACENINTSCQAQLVGFTSTSNYARIMSDWENSDSDNSNLLGNYSLVGVSYQKGYITVVLN